MYGKLRVPKSVKEQIDYLHTKYPGKEWSGVLAYRTLDGNFEELDDFDFEVIAIYLMDLGKGASTDFEYNEALANVYDICEEEYGYGLEDVKTGLIHSHHNMAAYFSSTDMSELKDNATKTNYYLSLVVNTDENYAAKVAFGSSVLIKEEHTIYDDEGNPKVFVLEKESATIIDLDLNVEIDNEQTLPEWFLDRYKEVEEENKKAAKTRSWSSNGGRGWGSSYGYGSRYGQGSYYREHSSKSKTSSFGKQASLPFPDKQPAYTEYEKELQKFRKLVADFGRELIADLTGRYFGTFDSAIKAAFETSLVSTHIEEFEEVYTKLYIKHFGGKPGEEYKQVADDLIEMIEISEPIAASKVDTSLLDYLKDQIYAEYFDTPEL